MIGFLPGSFDPPTNGHINIICRAAVLCERLVIGVTQNRSKTQSLFSVDERIFLLKKVIGNHPAVAVHEFEGLAVDYARQVGATCLLRGIRSAMDAEYEFRMAVANRKVSGLETLFLMSDESYSHLSSSLIRELGAGGKDLSSFVPEEIAEEIIAKLKS